MWQFSDGRNKGDNGGMEGVRVWSRLRAFCWRTVNFFANTSFCTSKLFVKWMRESFDLSLVGGGRRKGMDSRSDTVSCCGLFNSSMLRTGSSRGLRTKCQTYGDRNVQSAETGRSIKNDVRSKTERKMIGHTKLAERQEQLWSGDGSDDGSEAIGRTNWSVKFEREGKTSCWEDRKEEVRRIVRRTEKDKNTHNESCHVVITTANWKPTPDPKLRIERHGEYMR